MNASGNASPAITWIQVDISPHDPIIIRDARPFAAEGEGANRARILDWPYPSTVAGSLRTLIGRLKAGCNGTQDKAVSLFNDDAFLQRLKSIKVRGPLPEVGDDLYVPAPRDFLKYEHSDKVALRPMPLEDGEGCDLPHSGLWPVIAPSEEKPEPLPAFWSIEDVTCWLANDVRERFDPEKPLAGFKRDERIHLKMDPRSQKAEEGKFFITEGLVIPDITYEHRDLLGQNNERSMIEETRLSLLVEAPGPELRGLISELDVLQPLGGERRLALFQSKTPLGSWLCPDEVKASLSKAKGVRMLLATPAVFKGGWLPGWLDPETLEGSPPGVDSLLLRLRGACVGRWRPLSGWSMEKGQRGPKPLKRLVPSGSVYFFEVIEGSPESLADMWLCPVSDGVQDCNDGFGLALWGVWRIETTKGGSIA